MTKIIDLSVQPNPAEDKIFFGEYGNYVRSERVKHKVIQRLKEHSEGNTWFPKEIDFSKDSIESMPEHAQRMFKLNITFQTLMDSGVDNGYSTVMKRLVTSTYPNLAYGRVGIEESIHAESYSYGLNQMFGTEQAEKILDLAYVDPFIRNRLDSEVNEFSEVYELCLVQGRKDDEAKKAILRMLLRLVYMEAIKFPLSFLVSLTLNKKFKSCIQGTARLIKLIAHDELSYHVPLNKAVLRILATDPSEGFTHLFDSGWFREEALRLGKQTVESEKDWSAYLLRDGEIPGFNQAIADHFLEYHFDKVARFLGIEEVYGVAKNDIVTFFDNERNIGLQNTAQQEAENSGYQKGVMKNDLSKYDELLLKEVSAA